MPNQVGKLTSSTVKSHTAEGDTRDSFWTRAVGKCPRVTLKIGGVKIEAVVDTGSQVTTVTEAFYAKHLGKSLFLAPRNKYFTLTAANGLGIPLSGYLVVEVQVGTEVIQDAVIMVVNGAPTGPEQPPCLLGMNILQRLSTLPSHLEMPAAIESQTRSRFSRASRTSVIITPEP